MVGGTISGYCASEDTKNHDDDGDDVGENRMLDEELRHGMLPLLSPQPAGLRGAELAGEEPGSGADPPPARSGVTSRPGMARSRPSTISHSSPFRPDEITRFSPTC